LQNSMKKIIHAIRHHWFFHKYPTTKEFIKYSAIGVIVTLLDFGIYALLTRTSEWLGEHFLLANLIAFVVATSVSFFANKNWTFRNHEEDHIIQYQKFFAVNVIGLLLSQLILFILVTTVFWHDMLAKAVATIVVIVWRFILYKHWIFK